MKTHDAVAQLPFGNARANRDDSSGNFMSENLRGRPQIRARFFSGPCRKFRTPRPESKLLPLRSRARERFPRPLFPCRDTPPRASWTALDAPRVEVSRIIPGWLIARPPYPARWEPGGPPSFPQMRPGNRQDAATQIRESRANFNRSGKPAGLRKTCETNSHHANLALRVARPLEIVWHIEIHGVADGSNRNRRHAASAPPPQGSCSFPYPPLPPGSPARRFSFGPR